MRNYYINHCIIIAPYYSNNSSGIFIFAITRIGLSLMIPFMTLNSFLFSPFEIVYYLECVLMKEVIIYCVRLIKQLDYASANEQCQTEEMCYPWLKRKTIFVFTFFLHVQLFPIYQQFSMVYKVIHPLTIY